MPAVYDKNAPKNPDCKACQQDWPIHVDQETGERWHIDVLGFHCQHGLIAPCPTQHWPEVSDDTAD